MAKYSEPFDDANYYNDDPVGLHQQPQKRKIPAIFGALLLLVGGSFFVQTTFAIPATVNFLSDVEFGQGVTQAVACDSNGITVTPFSTFDNAAGADAEDFKLAFIKISGVDIRAGKCAGKIFEIKVYSDSGQLDIFNWEEGYSWGSPNWTPTSTYNSIRIRVSQLPTLSDGAPSDDDVIWISGGTDHDDVIDIGGTEAETEFTLKLASIGTAPDTFRRNPVAMVGQVKKITIETSDAYKVGDYGPGGGVIFYYSAGGFRCGENLTDTCNYLEAAPRTFTEDQGRYEWSGNVSEAIGTTGTAIGTGYKNTLAMVFQSDADETAGTVTRAYRVPVISFPTWFLPSKSDWYLPSKDELNQLFLQRSIVRKQLNQLYSQPDTFNNFTTAEYWSSSEASATAAWVHRFADDEVDAGPYQRLKREQEGETIFISTGIFPVRSF